MPVDFMLAIAIDPALIYIFYENANKTGLISGSMEEVKNKANGLSVWCVMD